MKGTRFLVRLVFWYIFSDKKKGGASWGLLRRGLGENRKKNRDELRSHIARERVTRLLSRRATKRATVTAAKERKF
jgi:hypothetical protein